MIRLVALLIGLASGAAAQAHPLAPALFEVLEVSPGQLQVTWKTPRSQATSAVLSPEFPQPCQRPPRNLTQQPQGSGLSTRFQLTCDRPLAPGDTFTVSGLNTSLSGVLLRVTLANGAIHRHLLNTKTPAWHVGLTQTASYWIEMLRSGVSHLAGGIDHLLFIACLVLLTPRLLPLLGMLTAFTVGHSVTLALATLGLVQLPTRIVESLIALSIVFVAAKLVDQYRAPAVVTPPLHWWLCAAIGLLHGLGFAGALNMVGVPDADIPLALFSFNLGIEIGQIIAVTSLLVLLKLMTTVPWRVPRTARVVPVYGIGSCAGYWVFARLIG